MTALSQSENGGEGLPPYRPPRNWADLVAQLRAAGERIPTSERDEMLYMVSSLLHGLLDEQTPPEQASKDLRRLFGMEQVMRGPIDREAKLSTAYHEAGHAVVGRLLGFRVLSATAEPSPEHLALGVVCFEPAPFTDADAVTEMAGPIAQGVAGYPAPSHADHETRVYAKIIRTRGLNPTETMALVGYFRERARTLVAKHWKAITTLAAVLVEVPELTGGELDDTINRALAAETEPAHKEIAA